MFVIKFDFRICKTALHIAIENENFEIVQLLLSIKDVEINSKSIYIFKWSYRF